MIQKDLISSYDNSEFDDIVIDDDPFSKGVDNQSIKLTKDL